MAGTLAVYPVHPLSRLLVYDRGAILSGEVWRLLTGHIVHFSLSHLLYNVLVVAIAGWFIEHDGDPAYGLLVLTSALCAAIPVLLFETSLERYGGLSGIATASVVYLALRNGAKSGPGRWIWIIMICFVAVKIVYECLQGSFFFVRPGTISFRPMPQVHLAGGIVALVFWITKRMRT